MAEDIIPPGYCMKCKAKREIQDPVALYNKAGAPATRGHCAVCGTTVYRTGRTAAHADIRIHDREPCLAPSPFGLELSDRWATRLGDLI